MKNKNDRNLAGFTLVEVLISLAIIATVVISILNGFAQRIHSDRNTSLRNIAITLAEAKVEEYLKFPSSQLTLVYPATAVDYIVYQGGQTPKISTSDPGVPLQYRRTADITQNGNLVQIRVMVHYGYKIPISGTPYYPFRVVLSTQRGL